MSEPRKASEVLLSLEEKVDNIVKIVNVYDFNMKLLLDRVNKIYAYINTLENEMLQERAQTAQTPFVETNFPQQQPTKEIFQSSQEHLIPVEENPVGHRRTARSETYSQPNAQQAMPITERPIQQPQIQQPKQHRTDSERKVPVIQRVVAMTADNSTKDLFMAEVVILDENKELITKTKTNAAGKWQAYLKPGIYSVNIVKTDTKTKTKIEAMQDINVGDSNSTITLPVMIIKR